MNNHRKFFNGGINADSSFDSLKPGEWINASNVRTFTTDSGAVDRIEAVGGTVMLYNTLPAGQNINIGGCRDDAKTRIYFFNWNSNGEHGIYCYDKKNAIGYTILVSSQVTGGLNFSKYNYIHSCEYIDNKLYWTDNLNEPRRINVEAGIKLNQSGYITTFLPYVAPLVPTVITLIRQAPNYCPSITKFTDSTFLNNFINKITPQFAIRYQYRDYEYSVIGPYSILSPYNTPLQLDNCITVLLPVVNHIEQDVFTVELVVRYANGNQPFVIRTFKRAEINSHNSGTALTYNFYNDVIGFSVDAVSAYKPFESIPLLAGTLELAKNRIFLANTVQGYDTPATTSLTLSLQSAGAGGLVTYYPWSIVNFPAASYYYYVLPTGFYYFSSVVPPATPPSPIDITTATFFTPNSSNLVIYFSGLQSGAAVTSFANTSFQSTVLGAINPSVSSRAFKANGTYKAATWFFDKYRRKCGIVYDQRNKITTPERDFGTSVYNSGILWQLSNTNALTEIPLWADSYCVARTKCTSTEFFMQGQAAACVYAAKDILNVATYITLAFAVTNTYLAVDISTIISFGMGYQYADGDVMKLYFDQTLSPATPMQELAIVGQDGKYVLLQLKDIGPLPLFSHPKFEIYTPYKQSVNELYYEVGATFPITNSGTSGRGYSTLSGLLNGDIYLIQRTVTYPLASGGTLTPISFYTENMSPIDKFWKIWQTDIGIPNAFDIIGQTTLPNQIGFSDVYLVGTKVNGLSNFSPLNVKTLDNEDGTIIKLVLANKIQTDGSVLLAICEDETVSCYLGEQELFDTQGSAFLATASNVIGTTKALKGSNGSRNPESVFQHNGLVFWYDARNGAWVRYADNGLFPISNNKLVRSASLFSKKFNSLNTAAIEALGSFPYVIGGYDPYHKEGLFSIPTTEATPPKGFLPDFPSRPYPYDIYDGQGKTLIYKSEADVWMGSMSFQAERFITMGNELFSFKNGALYIHNQPNLANFYGVQNTAQFMFSNNPGAIHRFLSMGIECNKKPSWAHLRTEDPNVQSSDLVITDYITKEGVHYASILRDRLSPNTTGSYIQKQMSGDPLYGKALLTMLEFEFVNDTKALALRFTDVGHTVSKGHSMTNGKH